ncbi:MAG TPA: condensation domain-containing protein, partial [Thermoanaerobaculia bacterium]|nr:condensation domain-containing protein [Thermoanaerobaculia bacterium]
MNPTDIELIYELSPMQQAMLFHSLYAPGSGVYVLQMSLRLTGRLDVSAFERAWRHILGRHGILRSAFFWEDLEQPRQVVFRNVELEVARDPIGSLRDLDPDERQARLAGFLEADRERGFDLSLAPLMRLALIELADGVHQLVWTQHHLVVDGWSQGQVLRELIDAYAAFAGGGEPRLERPGSFREYITWLQRRDLREAESFWRESLGGFTAPTFIANGANGNGKAEGAAWRESQRRDLALPAAVSDRLRQAARESRLTLNTMVQGAWALVLAQATGREDVVFGATVSGRPADLPGVESIVGPFINTLPLRVEARPESRLREWLADLQRRQVEMRRYEHAPLVDVQRWSGLPAGTALFDHVLVFENLALPADRARPVPDLEIREEAASSLSNYPLMVVAIPGDGLTLSLRWGTEHFEATAVARMLERLASVLPAMTGANGDAGRRLGDLPLLLEAERQQVLVEANDTHSSYPREASIPELFAAVAGSMPEAPAVVEADGEVWSYGRLRQASSRLARHLAKLGIRPGARVGVAMERSADLLVAFLAVLEAGAAYVPLDPGHPDERLAYLLDDAGTDVVLVHERTQERMAGLAGSPVLAPAVSLEPFLEPSPSLPSFALGADALAYVIYTSGSTGRPKGVAVPHRAILRLVRETSYLTLAPGDRLAFNANTSFDAATFEIWATLLAGATLVVIPQDLLLAPLELAARLESERVTVLHLTAALFAQVAREAPAVLARLRCALFGGEASAPAAVAQALAEGKPRRLLHMYGPTESTTFATWHT